MEFKEKLFSLRKQKGFTQEELAEYLNVSRTAISKWESGRGYPNIDSLKSIAKLFSITVDELLSGDELIVIAQEESKKKENSLRDLVFGLLDVSVAIMFFVPLFGQKSSEVIKQVSLISLFEIASYLRVAYFAVLIGIVLWGIATLALQNCTKSVWNKNKSKISLILNTVGALLFIVSLQSYAAVLMFVFLIIKTFMIAKKQ